MSIRRIVIIGIVVAAFCFGFAELVVKRVGQEPIITPLFVWVYRFLGVLALTVMAYVIKRELKARKEPEGQEE